MSTLGSLKGLPFAATPDTPPMPALFVGHGSPMNAIEDNEFSLHWRELGRTLPRPQAIVCVSAHWETDGTRVTAMPQPSTIHDFGGFPKALFEVQYPAPGDPELARDTASKVHSTTVGLDQSWGLDHGSWSVIRRMYPKADIPVIQVSLDKNKDASIHYSLGKELAFLRKKGILVIGSGNMVHNLALLSWDMMDGGGFDWAIQANDIFKKYIRERDFASLADYRKLGKEVSLAVPYPDHFLPMLYILGMTEENEAINIFNDQAVGGSLTMTSFQVG